MRRDVCWPYPRGVLKWEPLPDRRPGELRDKLGVAWVAYQSHMNQLKGGKAECELSILYYWTLMCYVGESASEKALNRLRKPKVSTESGWLRLTRKSVGLRGNHYRVGTPGEADIAQWVAVGEMLFGPGGVLEPYRCRPVFLDKGLTPYGSLVLAFIEKFGPVSKEEIDLNLESYMSQDAVTKRLGYLVGFDLVKENHGRYSTPTDIRVRVEDFERIYALTEMQRNLEKVRNARWLGFHRELRGKPELELFMSVLRKLDCFYCQKSPPPSGGQVEHFPPVMWGGSDETSLLLPICQSCNTTHGGRMQNSGYETTPKIDSPLQFPFDGDREEAIAHFLLVMLYDNLRYATAMNDGNIEEAKSAALAHAEIWAALRSDSELVTFIDTSTGEVRGSDAVDPFLALEEYLEAYQGIPEMVSPLRRKDRKKTISSAITSSRTWGRFAR